MTKKKEVTADNNSAAQEAATVDTMKGRDILMTNALYSAVQAEARSRDIKSANAFIRQATELFLKMPGVPMLAVVHAGTPGDHSTEETHSVYCSELPSGDRYGYVRVCGQSLSKRIPHGALALIKQQAPYREGDVVAVCISSDRGMESCLKVVERLDCGMMMLMPDPAPEYSAMFRPICIASPEDKVKGGRFHDDIPEGAIVVDPDDITVEGVWTGDYIFPARQG